MSKYLDFISSCYECDTKALEEGLKEGYDINEPGLNLLTQAIAMGLVIENDYIDALIENGIDINQTTENGRNALFYATARTYPHDLIPRLIKAGININQLDKKGNNALMYMCSSNPDYYEFQPEDSNVTGKRFASYLDRRFKTFDKYMRADKSDKELYTKYRVDTANKLISSGINIIQLNDNNQNALDIAIKHSEIELIKALARRGLQTHAPIPTLKHNGLIYKIEDSRRRYIIKRCYNGK